MMKKATILFTTIFGFMILSYGQTTEIDPQGTFKEIDVTRHNKAIKVLGKKNTKLKQQTVDSILASPNYYNPPVIYALSRELYNQDKKDNAMFWFYVAQLRARYDANLCMDNTAKQAVSILNGEYGPDINKYAFQDMDKLEKTVTKVCEFVRSNEENYDHRWINLHGMDAVMTGLGDSSGKKELSQPKDNWAEIKNKTIDDYYSAFVEYIKSKKIIETK